VPKSDHHWLDLDTGNTFVLNWTLLAQCYELNQSSWLTGLHTQVISLIINYSLHFLDLPSHPFPCKYGVDLVVGGIFGILFIITRPLIEFCWIFHFWLHQSVINSSHVASWLLYFLHVWYRSLITALWLLDNVTSLTGKNEEGITVLHMGVSAGLPI
jgi:hypothetical protein